MIDLTEITANLNSILLVLARVLGLVATSPLIKSLFLPPRITIFLAMAITVPVFSGIETSVTIDSFGELAYLAITELLFGASAGLVSLLILETFSLAGQFIANSMGLGFAMMVNPSTGTQTTVISNIFALAGMIIFLGLGGHLLLLNWIGYSFTIIPLGEAQSVFNTEVIGKMFASVFALAVSISVPFVFPLLLMNMTFGIIARTAPTLNIFSIGFPAVLITGLALLPVCIYLIEIQVSSAFLILQDTLLGAFSG